MAQQVRILYAWYANSQFFRDYSIGGFKENPVPTPVLGKTHFKVPIKMTRHVEPDTPIMDIVDEAFNAFNWVALEFAAPQEVNDFARKTDTHASMSVGDVVEVEGHYYICESIRFAKRITLNGMAWVK